MKLRENNYLVRWVFNFLKFCKDWAKLMDFLLWHSDFKIPYLLTLQLSILEMDKRSLASKSWLWQFIDSVLIVLILLRSVLQQHVAKAVCILSRKNWSFGCKVVYFEGLAPVFCERITILAESEVKRPILSFGYKFMSRLNFAKWNLYLPKSSGTYMQFCLVRNTSKETNKYLVELN